MIKIEVTGNSIGEVADKLLAIGSSLRANKGALLNSAAHPVAINPIMPEVADISPEALEEVEIEVAEPVPAPQPAPEPKPTPAPAPAPAPPPFAVIPFTPPSFVPTNKFVAREESIKDEADPVPAAVVG